MDVAGRRELARRALDGYVSGPIRATARALAKVDNAVAVVLVEGISDQIALETAAVGRGSRAALRRTRRERNRAPSCCSQDQGARICRGG